MSYCDCPACRSSGQATGADRVSAATSDRFWTFALAVLIAVGLVGAVIAQEWPASSKVPVAATETVKPVLSPVPTATVPPLASPGPPTAPKVLSGFAPRSLAFIRDGNLWVEEGVGTAGSPGRETQVTENGGLSRPSWSFSGTWITAYGFGRRWLISSQGALTALDSNLWSAAWSPTEDVLAYATTNGVYLYDATPGSARQLLAGGSDQFAWSPDGNRLAIGNDDHRPVAETLPAPAIRVVSVATDHVLDVSLAPVRGPETIVAGWTSDGRSVIAWVNPVLSASIRADGVQLYDVPLSGGAPIQLGGTLLYSDYVSPQPGGSSTVAFVLGGGRMAWENKRLAVAELPSTGAMLPSVAPGAVASPAWSPDGTRIAYVAGPELPSVGGGDKAKAGLMQRRIWLQPANSGVAQQLTADPAVRDEHPQWGGPGCFLFARVNGDDEAGLWLFDTATNQARRMTGDFSFTDSQTSWFGYYGHIDWPAMYDWWPGHGYTGAVGVSGCPG